MGAFDFLFGVSSVNDLTNQIAEIFPLELKKNDFIEQDILFTYTRILTDVIERTHGIPDKYESVLWDNCLYSEVAEGLITLIAKAMTNQSDLFVVFKNDVIRKADSNEEAEIRKDYKSAGGSKVGVFLSFRNYRRTQMLNVYSGFEYCVLSSLNKTLNLSKAVQVKTKGLRDSVSLADSSVAITQAKGIATALRNGDDVLVDAEDAIETANPDTSSTEKAITFLDSKRAFYLGLPTAYVNGEQTGGIGSTGENDMRAVERGLRQYFVSIVKPVLKALFKVDVEFRSQDFRQMTTALQVLKDFDLTSDDYLSAESKRKISARVFELDEADEEKKIVKEGKNRESAPNPTRSNPDSDTSGNE